jgi:predicted amidohydrolase
MGFFTIYRVIQENTALGLSIREINEERRLVRVGGVQMRVSEPVDISHHTEIAMTYIDEAAKRGLRALCFPEVALTGFQTPGGPQAITKSLARLKEATAQYEMIVLIGLAFPDRAGPFNRVVIMDSGRYLGFYDKLQLEPGEQDAAFKPGGSLPVFQTSDLTFGVQIGRDLFRFPELTRSLVMRGAEIIFHCANTGSDPVYLERHTVALRSRAFENVVYVVCANALHEPANCPSAVFDTWGRPMTQVRRRREHLFWSEVNLSLTDRSWVNEQRRDVLSLDYHET